MNVVSNAGPLIALAKIERFHLLRDLFGGITIPHAVFDEVVVRGGERAGAHETVQALNDWISIVPVRDLQLARSMQTQLGTGEAEAIALAIELPADYLLLDDRKARSVARFLSVEVLGAVGVLRRAQRRGFLSDLKPAIDALRMAGYHIGDAVYRRILDDIGDHTSS